MSHLGYILTTSSIPFYFKDKMNAEGNETNLIKDFTVKLYVEDFWLVLQKLTWKLYKHLWYLQGF